MPAQVVAGPWSGEDDARPVVRYDADHLDETIDGVVDALRADEGLYQRGGELVHVVQDLAADGRALGQPSFRSVNLAHLRDRAARSVAMVKPGKQGEVTRCRLPDEVVSGVLARGQWQGLRVASAIVEQPVLRPDGTVFQQSGYDAQTGLVLMPSGEFLPVPDRPTRFDAVQALIELQEVFSDFPFAAEWHASAALASLLTMFARPAIDGPCPLMMVEASTRGTGKTRLIDAVATIATGREASKRSYSTDIEEMRKVYASVAFSGRSMLVLDNIMRAIGDPSLDSYLTSSKVEDRVLGESRSMCVENRMVIFGSSNNPVYLGDTARRTLPIRLESKLENPEERQDFKHPDLLGWCRTERPRLVRAALTLLRAWAVSGRPDMGLPLWGSFEAWSRVVPAALVFAGATDPMQARRGLEAASDPQRNALATLLQWWGKFDHAGTGVTIGSVLKQLYPRHDAYRSDDGPPEPEYHEAMREAALELAASRSGDRVDPRALGMAIRRARGRVIDGRMFVEGGSSSGSMRWKVQGG